MKRSAEQLLLASDRFCPVSPVKAAQFESHLSRLQADSNYLLSEEFEVGPAPSLRLSFIVRKIIAIDNSFFFFLYILQSA